MFDYFLHNSTVGAFIAWSKTDYNISLHQGSETVSSFRQLPYFWISLAEIYDTCSLVDDSFRMVINNSPLSCQWNTHNKLFCHNLAFIRSLNVSLILKKLLQDNKNIFLIRNLVLFYTPSILKNLALLA